MKKALFTTFVALMTVFCFSSCSKEKDLAGTTWQFQQKTSGQIEEEGMSFPYEVDLNLILNFTDEENGKLEIHMNMEVAGMSMPMDDSAVFTYTFDGENGVMTADGEPQPFVYHKDDNTIGMSVDTEGMSEEDMMLLPENGLLNFGDASSGAIQDSPSLSKTVAVCNDMLNADIYLKSSYKGSTGSILIAVSKEYVDDDGNPKPGMSEKIYIKDKHGRSMLRPEFIKGFVSNVPGENICQYRSRNELMQGYSEKESI